MSVVDDTAVQLRTQETGYVPFPPDKPTFLSKPIPPSIDSDDEVDEEEEDGEEGGESGDEDEDDDEEESGSDEDEGDGYYHVPGKTMKERRKNKNQSHRFGLPPEIDPNTPLFKPHGRWAWTYNQPIEDTETIKQISCTFLSPVLSSDNLVNRFKSADGAQAEVYYKTGRIGRTTFDYVAKW